jgi:hypothetical protein
MGTTAGATTTAGTTSTTAATTTTATASTPAAHARPERTMAKGRLWRSRWTVRGDSDQCSRGGREPRAGDRCSLSTQSDLFQGEVVADLEKGREGALAHDQRLEVGVAIDEAAEDVEDKVAVLHGAA